MAILSWKGKKAYVVNHLPTKKREWVPLKNPLTGRNHFETKHEGKMAFLEWLKWHEKKITEKDILFKTVLDKFLELRKAEKAETTYKLEKNHSGALKEFYNIPVSEVTARRVEEFKKTHTWKPTTWSARLSLLKNVLKYAQEHNFKTSPCIKAIKIPRPKIHEMMPRYVGLEVIDAVIDRLKGQHKAYAMILKHLMLRPIEVPRLKNEYVDYKNKVIRVLGKNKLWSFLPFTEELEPYLKELPLQVSQDAFASALKRVCNKKDWTLPKVTPYVFRHSSASALVNSNITGGTRVVQALLRHSDPKLTTRYAHPYEETMRNALKVLGK